ncbi:MAG: ABC transporter ATP-binding protein [Gammaproteobacteria bacterium]|nr:ABC transporter ATP-binding protein [Gammaproteobacteria bacterium]
MLVLVAFMEIVGVASIMPFMAVVANPDVVHTNPYLVEIYGRLGFLSTDAFLFFLGVFFLALMTGSLAFHAFAFWVMVRFSQKRNHAWCCRLVQGYLARPYDWFLNRHSGTLGSVILNEVNRAVEGALFPSLQLISKTLVAMFLLALMIVVDPALALSVCLIIGGAYGALFLTVRRYLGRVGQDIQTANRQRYKITQEMFGGIKDVKVCGLELPFLARFRDPSLIFAERQITSRVVSELPSFAMQALVFGGIMVVLLYFMANRGGLQAALPVFSLYALAGYRLMPTLQAIYTNLAAMQVNAVVLDSLHRDLCGEGIEQNRGDRGLAGLAQESPMGLSNKLELRDVFYRYPGADYFTLEGVSLEITARTTVALVGLTGSGKTTLVDVLLGLLVPEQGTLITDGKPVTDELRRAWQRSIGYVPQQIYLADDTIAANIAFGIPTGEINHEAVECAARIANLHDFVANDLSEGYRTIVGERGVRLSGGQRQRIGIARALYHDPDVLILDEATSALDNVTEQAVMEAVGNLGHRKTIVLIAHRLSTVQQCGQIFYIEAGHVIANGTYESLLKTNSKFRLLAGGGS